MKLGLKKSEFYWGDYSEFNTEVNKWNKQSLIKAKPQTKFVKLCSSVGTDILVYFCNFFLMIEGKLGMVNPWAYLL